MTRSITVALVAALVVAAPLLAADQPISGARLQLRKNGTKQQLVFRSDDPAFLFPPQGSGDDPAGSPGGLLVELFSANEGSTLQLAPRAGWVFIDRSHDMYRFSNRLAASPIRTAELRQARGIRVTGTDVGLPLDGAQGAVGIRITAGSRRNCALFGPTTVQRDVAGEFRAHNALASAIADCSDVTLTGTPTTTTTSTTTTTLAPGSCADGPFPTCGGACPVGDICGPDLSSGCRCISPSSPCGGTAPVCNGTCAAGEACVAVGHPTFPSCYCVPSGSTPCGSPGAPTCGGTCPGSLECNPIYSLPILGGQVVCECTGTQSCGSAGGGRCANGWACGVQPPNPQPNCFPIFCNGAYPICGGGCGDGGVCTPFSLDFTGYSFQNCLCAEPASCDNCGGWGCPSGEACHVNLSAAGTCGCSAP